MDYGRTQYLRIPKNKFWGWVIVSFAVGIALGAGLMALRQGALTRQITTLKTQVATASQDASASAESLQKQLAESQVALADMTQKYNDLAAQSNQSNTTPGTSTSTDQASTTDTITVISRTISPSTVATGGAIAMVAKVKGPADKVTMRITGPNGYDQTFALTKVASGATETWKKTTSAPKKAGDYRYFATAYLGTTKVTMVGASPSQLKVK